MGSTIIENTLCKIKHILSPYYGYYIIYEFFALTLLFIHSFIIIIIDFRIRMFPIAFILNTYSYRIAIYH